MLIEKPLQINQITLKNRIVMPPMARELSEDGKVPNNLINYYKERSECTGLIIVEHEYVSIEGKASPKQLSMADDSVIDSYKKLTETIHKYGSYAISQINHAGFESISPNRINLNKISKEKIEEIKNQFLASAIRTKKSGFDGVEIHSAHGYLLSQFYSPYTNKRTDEYGGSLENRIRLHCEIIKEIRKYVGKDYIIAIRFGAYDYLEDGSKLEDIPFAVKSFVEAGVNLIDISGGLCRYVNPYSKEAGWFKDLSKIAKESVEVPIMLTGGVKKVNEAESLLEEGVADLIGVGRAMIMDGKWSKKALEKVRK